MLNNKLFAKISQADNLSFSSNLSRISMLFVSLAQLISAALKYITTPIIFRQAISKQYFDNILVGEKC